MRFSKASSDPEFAEMLKARSLPPEHLETQRQLRSSIRVRLTVFQMMLQRLTYQCRL